MTELNNTEKEIYTKISDEINNWLLTKYPLFDTLLEDKIKQSAQAEGRARALIEEYNEHIKKTKTDNLDYFKKEINKFLDKEHPGVASKLYTLAASLGDLEKKLKENDKIVNLHLKKVMVSQSLHEDVYAMRDEMKIIKEEWKQFSDRLRKIFK